MHVLRFTMSAGMTRHIRAASVSLSLLFLLVFLLTFLLGVPRTASAYLIFNQPPPDETYNGAVLDSQYRFISFGCTLNLDCGAAGETAYRVGVWMQKVGSPKNVRLVVVEDWQDIHGTSTVASIPISADTISGDSYTLVWFDFPQGVVIGERGAGNQFFQFQFADAPGTYDALNHYRVLFHETDDFSGPMQWCKKYSGCFSSQFYWQMDAGPVPQAPGQFYATTTVSGTERYADHFDADPSWDTDQPEHFSWDAARHELRAHMENTPPAYRPNRYFVKALDIDPTQSFSVSADLLMEEARGGNGAMLFGLFADDFTHENLTPTIGSRIYSKSTLNLKLMSLGGGTNYFQLNVIGQDGVQQSGGGSGSAFRRYRWYTFYLRYDAETKHVYGTIIDTKTGLPRISLDADMPAGFSPDMRYLGVTMHPEGELHSTMAGTEQRLAGASDFRIDNVRVLGAASTTPELTGASNVFFIPGLEASRLYMQEGLFENRLWEPNRTADIEKLYLNENGESIESGIYTRDVIDAAFGFNIYKKFMESLDKLVTDEVIAEWRAFPYDWRRSVDDVVRYGTSVKDGDEFRVMHMADELIDLASASKSGKVTIVGHSNGGLIGKLLIDELVRRGRADLVDKFIMVAVPQLGTPAALAGLLHGDKQTIPEHFGILMHRNHARQLAENMPGAYGLLPSGKYFGDVFDPVIEFDSDVSSIYDFPALYGGSIDSRDELEDFVLGDSGGRIKPSLLDTDSPNILNAPLLRNASNTQAALDTWAAPPGIQAVQIVGWGLDTIRGIRYDDCDILLCPDTLSNLDRELLWVDDGDGTVVVPSANGMDGVETYYVNLPTHNFLLRRNREHADILEVEPVQALVENIIKGNATTTLPTHITPTKPPAEEDARLRFRIHSPVSLDLYDAEGNHTGLVATTSDSDFRRFEAEISNSYYTEFGEVKYAGADGDSPTDVVLVGQDTGTFTLEIDEVRGNEVTESSTFTDIPVVEGARATVAVVDLADAPSLVLDIDNDGTNDATIGSGEGISAEEMTGILRGIVKTLALPPRKQVRIDKTFDKIDKTLLKEQKCSEKKKREKCEYKVKQKIDRTLGKLSGFIQKMSQGKKAVLTVEEATEVLEIIAKIRSNIGI